VIARSWAGEGALARLLRFYHTTRYLRRTQLWHQIRHRISPRKLIQQAESPSCPARVLNLQPSITKPASYTGNGHFTFLNQAADLGVPISWKADRQDLLWRYNLHYFDYLQQPSLSWETGTKLMRDWIAHHPVQNHAVGWDPYPLSLRIVNWLKFMNAHANFPEDLCQSLSIQAQNLMRQIEYHILGNHLFANGKALWFAGAFLGNAPWLETGRRIVLEQLSEQFLPDGGHFELSPMYHSLALEDVLDLTNLCVAMKDTKSLAQLKEVAARALEWLTVMTGPASRLPLLNDAAGGIAPSCQQLSEYGSRLAVRSGKGLMCSDFVYGWIGCNLSGYWVLQHGDLRVIFDTALLGPDYLPGHAHCDMLSLLVDFQGKSILADTGVFEYEESARRARSRSTAAHNTVVLDDLEQGDIWKSFRMARRGHPSEVRVTSSSLSCEHNGFALRRKGLKHRRTVELAENGFQVRDSVEGPNRHQYKAHFHFAPGLPITQLAESTFEIPPGLVVNVFGSDSKLITTEYYPEFGIIQQRPCLLLSGSFEHKREFGIKCTYSS
jgi:uncharacterized heparinase superfamily protein